jgi:hypothetical protein
MFTDWGIIWQTRDLNHIFSLFSDPEANHYENEYTYYKI